MTDDECARLSLNSDAHFSPPLFFYLTIFPHGLTICVGFEYPSQIHFLHMMFSFYFTLNCLCVIWNLICFHLIKIYLIYPLSIFERITKLVLPPVVHPHVILSVCSSVSTNVALLCILRYYIPQAETSHVIITGCFKCGFYKILNKII